MMVFIAAVTDPETDDWFSQAADDVGEVLNQLITIGSVASATGAPMTPIGILNSGLSMAQSKVSLKKSAFTVELNSSKVENIIPARGSLSEIGASTRYAGSMLTEAEAEAQRAEYLEHVAMNKNMASEITKLLLTPLNPLRVINSPVECITKEISLYC
jgi:hypothetical protein